MHVERDQYRTIEGVPHITSYVKTELTTSAYTVLAHFESNLSSYYSYYVIGARARLHPNGCS